MNQRAKARVLASLIPVVFIAIGFKAAEVLGMSWWWGFPLGWLCGGFLFVLTVVVGTIIELRK